MTSCSSSIIILSGAIPIVYVALLYVFDYDGIDRDNILSIKRRFGAALVANILSIAVTYSTLNQQDDVDVFQLMGLRRNGIVIALILPAILTNLCYFGSHMLTYVNRRSIVNRESNNKSIVDWRSIRNLIIAPISEELAFRSCSSSLLLQCFDWQTTVFISPLAFAICHFHHIIDMRNRGIDLREAIAMCTIQAVYTYLFGIYATFLFVRTGHILAPIISHAICNKFGLPSLIETSTMHNRRTSIAIWLCHLLGLFLWIFALFPLTDRSLYN